MKLGRLPIKYLGYHLLPERSYADYGTLSDKIFSSIKSWTGSTLSYGGRLQLTNSVLIGTISSWTASYILPMGVIREIEKLLKSFLWGGTRQAKVK